MPVKTPLFVAASVLVGWLFGTWSHDTDGSSRRDASAASISESDVGEPADRAREARKTEMLQKQMRQLESRMLAQERARPMPSERDPSEPTASPVTPEEALEAERVATARAATIFARRFEASTPAPDVAASYSNALKSSIERHSLPTNALQAVECTPSLCRITFRMGALARDDLEVLWGKEPLLHGSFDFVSEDGTERIVYAGLPDHPLEIPRPEEDSVPGHVP